MSMAHSFEAHHKVIQALAPGAQGAGNSQTDEFSMVGFEDVVILLHTDAAIASGRSITVEFQGAEDGGSFADLVFPDQHPDQPNTAGAVVTLSADENTTKKVLKGRIRKQYLQPAAGGAEITRGRFDVTVASGAVNAMVEVILCGPTYSTDADGYSDYDFVL